MRTLIYTDLQATDGHEKCFGSPTQSLQIGRVTAFYDRLLHIYQEYKCDCLWDLGDTTDDRSAIPVPAINAVCEALGKFPLSEWNLKLIGNHEQFLRNTKVHVGQMFVPYFTVVEANSAFVHGSTRILCCSYPANERDTVSWIKQQKTLAHNAKQQVVLLGHFPVVGCITGDGQLLAGIPKDVVSWVDLGLLGHIHKPQSVTKRVHYVGSPFQQNWGESGESKRVGIVDITNGEIQLQWISIDGFPAYQTVNFADFKECCTVETEDRFKVVLKSQAEAAAFYALPLAHRAEPIYEFVEADENASKAETSATGHKWSFDAIIKRYVESHTPEAKGIVATVDEMIDYGKTIAVIT